MQKVLRVVLWWPTLHKDAKDYSRACDVCQRVGKPSIRDEMLLAPVGSQFNFFNFPKSCLHLCLLNFKFLSHFANKRHFYFMRHLQIGFDLFFMTESVKTPPSLFGLS
jgi:hypothetical protein